MTSISSQMTDEERTELVRLHRKMIDAWEARRDIEAESFMVEVANYMQAIARRVLERISHGSA